VGADRKGPLAAFVVIAIIAAVLLVTSVRSQADPGGAGQQRLAASADVDPGFHAVAGGPAGAGSVRHAGPAGRTATSTSRSAARDSLAARPGHSHWRRWLARLWSGPGS
jgi:hypothetical protein